MKVDEQNTYFNIELDAIVEVAQQNMGNTCTSIDSMRYTTLNTNLKPFGTL